MRSGKIMASHLSAGKLGDVPGNWGINLLSPPLHRNPLLVQIAFLFPICPRAHHVSVTPFRSLVLSSFHIHIFDTYLGPPVTFTTLSSNIKRPTKYRQKITG